MKLVCDLDKCNGCMACVASCDREAIHIEDSRFTLNALIDANKCVNCNRCHAVCPNNTLTKKHKQLKWCQGWADDEKIRMSSSSGGIATSLIKAFLESGGYVCSCIFNNGQFVFEITNNIGKYQIFSGSKYVKSNPVGIHKPVKELLKQNNKVLFIGLPCQAAGLLNFIPEQYRNNLFTVDLICHGTPSFELLRIYCNQHNAPLTKCKSIKFRQKGKMKLSSNEFQFAPPAITDRYIISFLNALNYTENCYACKYACLDRVTDLTIGDNWGTELTEELYKGVSLMLCNTEKGIELINSSNLILKEVDIEKAIKPNGNLVRPSTKPKCRDYFIKNIDKMKYDKIVKKCFYKQCLKQDIKKIAVKIGIIKTPGK